MRYNKHFKYISFSTAAEVRASRSLSAVSVPDLSTLDTLDEAISNNPDATFGTSAPASAVETAESAAVDIPDDAHSADNTDESLSINNPGLNFHTHPNHTLIDVTNKVTDLTTPTSTPRHQRKALSGLGLSDDILLPSLSPPFSPTRIVDSPFLPINLSVHDLSDASSLPSLPSSDLFSSHTQAPNPNPRPLPRPAYSQDKSRDALKEWALAEMAIALAESSRPSLFTLPVINSQPSRPAELPAPNPKPHPLPRSAYSRTARDKSRDALKEWALAEMAIALAESSRPSLFTLPVINSQPSRLVELPATVTATLPLSPVPQPPAAHHVTHPALLPESPSPVVPNMTQTSILSLEPPPPTAPRGPRQQSTAAVEDPPVAEETGHRIRQLTEFGLQREKALEAQREKAWKAALRKAEREKEKETSQVRSKGKKKAK
jgi:hypothetical protein